MNIDQIDFSKNYDLVPVIIQEFKNKQVLMLGFMNKLALEKTLETKYVHFWSRSRKELWLKGKTSGNKLKVKQIMSDCDNDSLLVLVELQGNGVCHTGEYSCFFNKIYESKQTL